MYEDAAFMIFSHVPDLEATVALVQELILTHSTYPIFLSVHPGEQEIFRAKLPSSVHIYQDNEIFDSLLVDTKKRLESVKLNLHKLNLSHNWILMKSNEPPHKGVLVSSTVLESIEKHLASIGLDTDHYLAGNLGTVQDLYRMWDV